MPINEAVARELAECRAEIVHIGDQLDKIRRNPSCVTVITRTLPSAREAACA